MFDCLMPTVERFWITLIWRDFCRQAWQRRTLPIQRPATVSTSRWRRTLPKIWATSCTTLTLSPGSTQWWAEHSSMDQSILPHPCRWEACGAPTQASPVNAWPRSWTRSRGASVRRTTRCPGWTRVASSWPSGGKTRQKRWHSRLVLDYGGQKGDFIPDAVASGEAGLGGWVASGEIGSGSKQLSRLGYPRTGKSNWDKNPTKSNLESKVTRFWIRQNTWPLDCPSMWNTSLLTTNQRAATQRWALSPCLTCFYCWLTDYLKGDQWHKLHPPGSHTNTNSEVNIQDSCILIVLWSTIGQSPMFGQMRLTQCLLTLRSTRYRWSLYHPSIHSSTHPSRWTSRLPWKTWGQ